jgi:hypothetical protein
LMSDFGDLLNCASGGIENGGNADFSGIADIYECVS